VTSQAQKKPSALDAAAQVLGESGQAMACKELIDAMAAKGYWTSPGGRTPHATLYSGILKEINLKGAHGRMCRSRTLDCFSSRETLRYGVVTILDGQSFCRPLAVEVHLHQLIAE
jgi:hypothetical protein